MQHRSNPTNDTRFKMAGQRCRGCVWLVLLMIGPTLAADAQTYGAGSHAWTYTPVRWEHFVTVEGQPLPVPEQWLQDEEARIAHSLKLPEIVPRAVPFDFYKAAWRAWLPGTPRVAVQYHDHLCKTEAGEWIFRTVKEVEGLYFARPQGGFPEDGFMVDPYGPEAPWIERRLWPLGDKPLDQGWWFVNPPFTNYRYVEQPRRDAKWQSEIREPYVRLSGLVRAPMLDQNGKPTQYYKDIVPMQVVGISRISARYGYTWRGLRRERDREFGIAGGEVMIYDLETQEVLAVRRQFLIASKNPRGEGKAMWEVSAQCPEPKAEKYPLEFIKFAIDVVPAIKSFKP